MLARVCTAWDALLTSRVVVATSNRVGIQCRVSMAVLARPKLSGGDQSTAFSTFICAPLCQFSRESGGLSQIHAPRRRRSKNRRGFDSLHAFRFLGGSQESKDFTPAQPGQKMKNSWRMKKNARHPRLQRKLLKSRGSPGPGLQPRLTYSVDHRAP